MRSEAERGRQREGTEFLGSWSSIVFVVVVVFVFLGWGFVVVVFSLGV